MTTIFNYILLVFVVVVLAHDILTRNWTGILFIAAGYVTGYLWRRWSDHKRKQNAAP